MLGNEINSQILESREKELQTQLGILEIERKHIKIGERKLQFYVLFLISISMMVFAILPLFGYHLNVNDIIYVTFSMLSVVFGYLAIDSSKRLNVEKEKIKRLEILEFQLEQLSREAKEIITQFKTNEQQSRKEL